MNPYVIVSDAGCDLSNEMMRDLEITCIPLEVKFESEEQSRPSNTIDPAYMFAKLREGDVAKTSAANVDAFESIFTSELEKGNDIIYIGFSSGLSGTFNASRLAADNLKERYPERTIVTVDTLCASLGQGLLVYKAAKMKQAGASFDEVAKWLQDNFMRMAHWFTVDDLMFLKRGGRVSAATAVVGSLLNIKPVLHVDDEGHLISMSKARGRKGALQAMVDVMKDTVDQPLEDEVFISHGDCLDDAKLLKTMIGEQLGYQNVTIGMIGPTIGSHAGPGTLALFYFAKQR